MYFLMKWLTEKFVLYFCLPFPLFFNSRKKIRIRGGRGGEEGRKTVLSRK
jgi:hypothetical protein